MTDPNLGRDPGSPSSAAPVEPGAAGLGKADEPPAEPTTTPDPVVDDVAVVDDVVVVDDLDRASLFGLELVNAASLGPVIDEILDGPRRDDQIQPVVLTPNVDIVVHLDQAPDSVEADLFRRAQFCLPDGQPLVMVSGLLGQRLAARLPGSGLFHDLWPRIVEQNLPALVIASSDDIAARLENEHPKAGFIVPPIFDADDDGAIAEIVDQLLAASRATRPNMVLVGIGNPKDARIIAALFERWDPTLGPKPLCLGLGGSFSMYLGLKKRAPSWIQRIGMEWFYRFLQEPRRLFHRYFVRDMAFFGIVWREWRSGRSSR